MEMLTDVFLDALFDCLKMAPFLFAAFLLVEIFEHYSNDFTVRILEKVGKAGPVFAAFAGCVPQCGFSVMAVNLYAGGMISLGTLLSVFIATSDEAILIILSNPEHIEDIGMILTVKVLIAILAGYVADIFLGKKIAAEKSKRIPGYGCECGGHGSCAGILKTVCRHTVRILLYLFVFTAILNLCIEVFGIQQLSVFLLGDTVFQPIAAAVIGLIPNCAASVILTQLYLSGAISFASVIAGLCSGAGIGLALLFKVNKEKKENVKIVGALFGVAVIAGIALEIFGGI